jgi:hypothetical protein
MVCCDNILMNLMIEEAYHMLQGETIEESRSMNSSFRLPDVAKRKALDVALDRSERKSKCEYT